MTQEQQTFAYDNLGNGIYAINQKSPKSLFKYTKETIIKTLGSANPVALRNMSRYFLRISGHYQAIVLHHSNLFTFPYQVTPRLYGNPMDSAFQKNWQKVCQYTDSVNIAAHNRFITFTCIVDGAFYGYDRVSADGKSTLQQLPFEFCRSPYKINGVHAIEFDLKFFNQFANKKSDELLLSVFDAFPPEFKQMWEDYRDQKTGNWVLLDPSFARCHKINDDGTPLFQQAFPSIVNIENAVDNTETLDNLSLQRLIVQQIPVNKDTGQPLMSPTDAQGWHQNTKQAVGSKHVKVITTPLPVENLDLQTKTSTQSSMNNAIENAVDTTYGQFGSSKALFSQGDGAIAVDSSIKTDTSKLLPLLDQFTDWYNLKISQLVSNRGHSFELIFYPATVFNSQEMSDAHLNLAQYGAGSKLAPSIILGTKQTTLLNMIQFENEILNLTEKLVPLSSTHTGGMNEGGAPAKPLGKLTDKGVQSRELGT